MPVVIKGATVAGMAAAARLAYLGHDVTVTPTRAPSRWAGVEGPGGIAVDAMPAILTLPAAWRDLFTKSGAPLVRALNQAGLRLTEAPPAEHRFRDGTSLMLPTERGPQSRAIEATFGSTAAAQWRGLLDELDALWQARRHVEIDGHRGLTTPVRRRLWYTSTLIDVAERVDDERLATLIGDLGPLSGTRSRYAPALLATRLVIERTFGRWQVTDSQGLGCSSARLIDLLRDRLAERRVRLTPTPDDHQIDAEPRRPWLRSARAPRVSHEVVPEPASPGIREIIDHSGKAPVVMFHRGVGDGTLITRHDYRHSRRDQRWGWEPASVQTWSQRGTIVEPWAELTEAALAVYDLHERLTGEDSRPSNRDFVPPRAR
ncbi:MAG: hypothetical protein ACK5KO_05635 [Arachnia sp.]